MTVHIHNRNAYKAGRCRCDTCRADWAAYSRETRAAAAASAEPGVTAEGDFKHGTRRAYKDHGCRCDSCVTAMRSIWRQWSRDKRTQIGVAA